jgi:hypothetical protein
MEARTAPRASTAAAARGGLTLSRELESPLLTVLAFCRDTIMNEFELKREINVDLRLNCMHMNEQHKEDKRRVRLAQRPRQKAAQD